MIENLTIQLAVVLFAQPQPVKWTTTYEITDDAVLVTIHADIEEGWHLYSQNIEDGGPIPTSFHLDSTSSYTTSGIWMESESHVEFDSNFDMTLLIFPILLISRPTLSPQSQTL